MHAAVAEPKADRQTRLARRRGSRLAALQNTQSSVQKISSVTSTAKMIEFAGKFYENRCCCVLCDLRPTKCRRKHEPLGRRARCKRPSEITHAWHCNKIRATSCDGIGYYIQCTKVAISRIYTARHAKMVQDSQKCGWLQVDVERWGDVERRPLRLPRQKSDLGYIGQTPGLDARRGAKNSIAR
jgi:hypothetical protein